MSIETKPAHLRSVPGTIPVPGTGVRGTDVDLLRLNIGSGRRRLPGFLSVDNNANAGEGDVGHDPARPTWSAPRGRSKRARSASW